MKNSLKKCQHLVVILVLLSNLPAETQSTNIESIHKCFCNQGQIRIEDTCIERDITYDFVINELERTTKKLRSSKVDNVTISDLSCPSGYFETTIPGYEFGFLATGNLVHTTSDLVIPFNDYCIEHFSSELDGVQAKVKLCLKVSKVPLCCDDPYTCISNISNDVTLPMFIGYSLKQIPVRGLELDLNFTCETGTKITRQLIYNETIVFGPKLKYTSKETILTHFAKHMTEPEHWGPNSYCVTPEQISYGDVDNSIAKVTFCYEDPLELYYEACSDVTCISKCCPDGMLFSFTEFVCIYGTDAEIWKPTFYEASSHRELDSNLLNMSHYNIWVGYPMCGNGSYFLDPEDITKTVIKLLDNGNLLEERGNSIWEPYNYCVDNFKKDNRIVEKALVCFKVSEKKEKCEQATGIIYPILLILSAICLVLTLAVYMFVQELSAKIQGKSLVSSIVALLAAYICLVIVQLAYHELSMTGCSVIALCMQFSLLASFFWLNVMSYDIWRTFRRMKISKESASSSRKRFLLYSLYSWGCPLVIMIVTAIMQFLPDQGEEEDIVRPMFSETSCFFTHRDHRASWAYFHGFITIILVVNSFFFIHLAYILMKAQKVSENALGRRNQHYREWAKLYLKLFVVMGVTWIFEVVAYVEGSCSLWIVTDIINTLRGVFIFVIFVCKQDTLRKIRTRGSPALSSLRSTIHTSSSFFSRSSKRTSSLYHEPNTPSRRSEDTHFLPDQTTTKTSGENTPK